MRNEAAPNQPTSEQPLQVLLLVSHSEPPYHIQHHNLNTPQHTICWKTAQPAQYKVIANNFGPAPCSNQIWRGQPSGIIDIKPRSQKTAEKNHMPTQWPMPTNTNPVFNHINKLHAPGSSNPLAPTLHYTKIKSAALSKRQSGTQLEGSDNRAAGNKIKAAPWDAISPKTRPDRKSCHIPTAVTMARTFKAPRPHKSTESSAPTSKEMPSHSISIQA
ncbi:hypothetical protein Nepgr_017465 [Nepenthes gracilis]|uniref:Uncharacterized protein n=1 Tax=Nepenthes gracilis TaxID=150966 RepID=A0AAD3SRP1_NEPGR|nr:hypothetical protein Nepgr_017465 [Nepenthes gracilis]